MNTISWNRLTKIFLTIVTCYSIMTFGAVEEAVKTVITQYVNQLKWNDANDLNNVMPQMLENVIPLITNYAFCLKNMNGDYEIKEAKINLSQVSAQNMQNLKADSATYTPPSDVAYAFTADSIDLIGQYKATGKTTSEGQATITLTKVKISMVQKVNVADGKPTVTALTLDSYELESATTKWGDDAALAEYINPILKDENDLVKTQVNTVLKNGVGQGQGMWYEDIDGILKTKEEANQC